jgi:hypothetical protein
VAYTYAFDPSGVSLANKVTGETHVLTAVNSRAYHYIVPTFAPFFGAGLVVVFKDTTNAIRPLVEGLDYLLSYQFIGASRATAKPIYGGISLINTELSGVITLSYQTLGGEWTLDTAAISQMLSDTLRNPRTTSWEQIAGVPKVFPPIDHAWNLIDLVGMAEVRDALVDISDEIAKLANRTTEDIPQLYQTKQQLGLAFVQNYKIATDLEATAGVSSTRYMTPRASRLLAERLLASYAEQYLKKYKSNVAPAAGTWNPGDYVENTAPIVATWVGGKLDGVKYVIKGWKRITGGSTNIMGTDWVEDRIITVA